MSTQAREAYRKSLQQRQTVIFGTISAVLAVLMLLGTLMWLGIVPFPFDRDFTTKESEYVVPCPPADAAPADPTSITAVVYNNTNITGLAGNVGSTLAAAGVVINDTTNWTGDSFTDPVRIFTSEDGVVAAYTLRAFFPDAAIHIDPNLTSEVVEVVIGDGFEQVVEAPTEEQFQQAVQPIEGCVTL